MQIRRTAAALTSAAALSITGVAMATPASAASAVQDGLVNVAVGDVTILEDVNIAAAVDVVAQLCGIDVTVPANVAVLAEQATNTDLRSRQTTVCRTEDGKVKFTQN